MHKIPENDRSLLEILRDSGAKSVPELCQRMEITATAVRQKLDRLVASGLIARVEKKQPRGRPVFLYSISPSGLRSLGDNQSELAEIVWDELLQIDDENVRESLIGRISSRLAGRFQTTLSARDEAKGGAVDQSLEQKLENVVRDLQAQNMAVAVVPNAVDGLPVVRFSSCPYPDLSSKSHDVCEMETRMLASMTGVPMRLAECRCHAADGSCTYVPVTK